MRWANGASEPRRGDRLAAATMHPLLAKLTGGDRRSIGRVSEVVDEVLARAKLFPIVVDGMLHDDPVLRMRCADAVEKISIRHPEWLQPFRGAIIKQIAHVEQQEVRWHVAQMLPRLRLSKIERQKAVTILVMYLDDESKIVKTCAMQALVELAEQEPSLRPRVTKLVQQHAEGGSPAVKSRGEKLLRRLTNIE